MKQKTILCIVGTRPEAIKMAPVILALQAEPWARVRVLATAQHREMLDDALNIFGIVPDIDFDLMQPGQKLAELTARMLVALDDAFTKESPDIVIAQGDTTTVLSTALACFYRQIPFAHVEAGLRTGDMANPFPEEANRALAGRLATLHFAPTAKAKDNLIREGIPPAAVHLTGNTVIDALLTVSSWNKEPAISIPTDKRLILLTAHRRENFGRPLQNIFDAVHMLLKQHQNLHFLYPIHPNPNVNAPAIAAFSGVEGITLCPPLNYTEIVAVMKKSWLVLTDSGGIQEEAPALGKPVLVLREESERPEAIAAGVAMLVGCDTMRIVRSVESLFQEGAYRSMSKGASPYGDGNAAKRIVTALKVHFNIVAPS